MPRAEPARNVACVFSRPTKGEVSGRGGRLVLPARENLVRCKG